MNWEEIECRYTYNMHRLKVLGGWLIKVQAGFHPSICFYPDPNHAWEIKPEPKQ